MTGPFASLFHMHWHTPIGHRKSESESQDARNPSTTPNHAPLGRFRMLETFQRSRPCGPTLPSGAYDLTSARGFHPFGSRSAGGPWPRDIKRLVTLPVDKATTMSPCSSFAVVQFFMTPVKAKLNGLSPREFRELGM